MAWQDEPYRFEVKEGQKMSICSCGKTNNPPLCDGSHCGSEKIPYRLTFEKEGKIAICGCSLSKNLPYCDGSHRCKKS